LGTANVITTTAAAANRTVARVDGAGNVVVVARLTDAHSGDNARAAITTDGTAFWTSGNAGGAGAAANQGVRYFTYSGTAATTSTQLINVNARQIGVVGGNLVFDAQASISRFNGLPTSSATPTSLGITLSDAEEFQLLDRQSGVGDPNLGGAVDTLYVANN